MVWSHFCAPVPWGGMPCRRCGSRRRPCLGRQPRGPPATWTTGRHAREQRERCCHSARRARCCSTPGRCPTGSAHLPGAMPVPFYDGVDAIADHLPRDGTPIVALRVPHAASGRVVDARGTGLLQRASSMKACCISCSGLPHRPRSCPMTVCRTLVLVALSAARSLRPRRRGLAAPAGPTEPTEPRSSIRRRTSSSKRSTTPAACPPGHRPLLRRPVHQAPQRL